MRFCGENLKRQIIEINLYKHEVAEGKVTNYFLHW